MSFVLTKSSTLICAHAGAVKLTATQSKLTVSGSKVLVEGDLIGAPISGCMTVPNPNTSTVKCLSVTSAEGGVAGKLKVNGKGVLLEEVNGKTSGTVSGQVQTWSVQTAGETKLKAV
ncbi:MAG TPA: hypothetical protein VKD91_03230 [Pyrinomonadaceae bacterium]|nr:hypothetical protein [Pyrinomonadaceae bacterium]